MADLVASLTLPDQDLSLVEELREGSDEAFASLFATYQAPIHNLVFRLLDDPSEAPDVTQEVFLKVFRKIGGFRGECSLKTWIYRIAVHEASNYRRWLSRHRREELSLDEWKDGHPGLSEVIADPRETQDDWLLRQERSQAVETALSQVKESFRVAVALRDIEGLSYEEIADVLQVALGTVKSRILRGREGLKQNLAALLGERPAAACALQTAE